MALNLVQHREGPSVWDRAGSGDWDSERWGAAVAGGALLVAGVLRRGWPGLLLVLGGGALAWWAAGGADQRRLRRGRVCAMWRSRAQGDTVTEASEESFPASDAPSWTPTTGNTGPGRARTH